MPSIGEFLKTMNMNKKAKEMASANNTTGSILNAANALTSTQYLQGSQWYTSTLNTVPPGTSSIGVQQAGMVGTYIPQPQTFFTSPVIDPRHAETEVNPIIFTEPDFASTKVLSAPGVSLTVKAMVSMGSGDRTEYTRQEVQLTEKEALALVKQLVIALSRAKELAEH